MKLIKSIICICSLAGSVNAATISFSINTDTNVATMLGDALDANFTAYIGTYTGGALSPLSTFADIDVNFDTLYSADFATGDVLGSNGYLTAGSFNFTDAAGFANAPLFVFFTDGANLNALITGFGNIPADSSIPNSVDFEIAATNAPTLTYLLGVYNPLGENLARSGGSIVLNDAVPEPSAALLVALSSLSLLRRRRLK